ncbi:MAG: plastocyanin/azurin family copper-binding protein, partial [Nitrospinota bacterium]
MKKLVFSLFFIALASQDAHPGSLFGNIKIKRVRNLSNTVICLAPKGDFSIDLPPINPMMDQRKLEFIPHVLVVPRGATVDFLNNDEAKHNIFSPDEIADKFDFGYYSPGQTARYTFKTAGIVSILCNKHDEMEAFVYVCESHLHTKAGRKGDYKIENVPPG